MAWLKIHTRLQCTNAFDKGDMYPMRPYLHFTATQYAYDFQQRGV